MEEEQSELDRLIAERHALNTPEINDEIERAMRTVEAMDNLDTNNVEEVTTAGPPPASVEHRPEDVAFDLNSSGASTPYNIEPVNIPIPGTNISTNTVFVDDPIEVYEKQMPKPVKKISTEDVFYEKITDIANAVLGEDNVSLELDGRNSMSTINSKYLMLKWDVINMYNKYNHKHTIKDMYVALPIINERFSGSLHGMRGRISALENYSGYRHSHLYQSTNYLNAFCTGSDGINDLWADLQLASNTDEDFDIKFEGFIHQLESFLSYESIEGTPYMRIKNISAGSARNGIRREDVNTDVARFFERIDESDIELSMDFNAMTVSIVETDLLHTLFTSSAGGQTVMQIRNQDGTYSNLDVHQSLIGRPETIVSGSVLKFKGRERFIIVEAYEEDTKVNDSKIRYVNEQTTTSFFERIKEAGKREIEKFCLQNFSIIEDEEESKIGTWKGFDPSNIVLPCNTTEQGVVGSPVLENEQGSGSGEARVDSNPF